MVFGNTFNVSGLIASTPQVSIHAMRTPRATSLTEIVRRTGLAADEVRRFNPALVDRVPAGATLNLSTSASLVPTSGSGAGRPVRPTWPF
jgi:hypothetical protein